LSYPASPTITDEFGLTERCGRRERGCEDRAWDAIRSALSSLEGTYSGPVFGTTETGIATRLYVRVTSDPPMEVKAGGVGEPAAEALFDVTGSVDGSGRSYVVVASGSGDERFVLSERAARALVDALYRPVDERANP